MGGEVGDVSKLVAIAWLSTVSIILTSCITTQPMEPGDVDLLVTVERLSQAGLDLPADYRQYESYKRQRITGGVVMLEYEFEMPDDGPIYIYSLAELHRTPRDACHSFSAGNVGIWFTGLELTERNDLFQYGSKSRFAVIENEGTHVGNMFAMCQSRTAMLVMFVGLYFDESGVWSEFIVPHLAALESFEIANP